MNESGTQAVSRAFDLLERIVQDNGTTPATAFAEILHLAPSTARRLILVMMERGLIVRIARGRYAGGHCLNRLAAQISPHHHIIEAARPVLRKLAKSLGGTAHLGVLDEEMVTYLVKAGERAVFTREREQLEAYCTGIGKALLAELSPPALGDYLKAPFVRLTAQTIVEPDALRLELTAIRQRGYAIDNREMADDVACVAVPLRVDGDTSFAISLSGDPERMSAITTLRIVAKLTQCATKIVARLPMPDAVHSPRMTEPNH